MTGLSRRRALRAVGGSALATALAGCLSDYGDGDSDGDGGDSDGNTGGDGGNDAGGSEGGDDGTGGRDESDGGRDDPGSLPSYASWIGVDDLPDDPLDAGPGEMLSFVHVDFESFRTLFDGDSPPVEADPDAGSGKEPMIAIPTVSLLAFSFVPLILVPYGVDDVPMFQSSDGQGEPPVIDPRTATVVGETLVFSGEVNLDALESATEGFEAADQRGGYTVYEGTGGDRGPNTEGMAFAASKTAAVFPVSTSGDNPDADDVGGRERVDQRLDVAVGDVPPAAGANPEFEWTLRTAGDGAAVVGTHGKRTGATYGDELASQDGDEGNESGMVANRFEFEDLNDLPLPVAQVASMEPGGSAPVAATVALAYDDPGVVPSRGDLEAAFGATATERSLGVEGKRVTVEASWDDAGILEGQ